MNIRQQQLPHLVICLMVAGALQAGAEQTPRARDLGIPFAGKTGPLNAITDVPGVEVGHTTLISGDASTARGDGPVRTGVTAVLPRGRGDVRVPTFAGWFSQNGNGEMTGTTWVEESGLLGGPILITNTHSVGVVRDAVIAWLLQRTAPDDRVWWALPVVGETWDGWLNDIDGFHVTAEHAFHALDEARGGPVPEGNVGGGTGMICYEFKGGIGTASRTVEDPSGRYVVGVLVQANFGLREQLVVAGVPVGREILDDPAYEQRTSTAHDHGDGSIIVVVATDAPLLPHQLERVARRVTMGVARTGGIAADSSGDIFIAFSTANPGGSPDLPSTRYLPHERLTPIFEATVQATEEAIVNALIAADTMTGIDGHRAIALPHDRLRETLEKYRRLSAR